MRVNSPGTELLSRGKRKEAIAYFEREVRASSEPWKKANAYFELALLHKRDKNNRYYEYLSEACAQESQFLPEADSSLIQYFYDAGLLDKALKHSIVAIERQEKLLSVMGAEPENAIFRSNTIQAIALLFCWKALLERDSGRFAEAQAAAARAYGYSSELEAHDQQMILDMLVPALFLSGHFEEMTHLIKDIREDMVKSQYEGFILAAETVPPLAKGAIPDTILNKIGTFFHRIQEIDTLNECGKVRAVLGSAAIEASKLFREKAREAILLLEELKVLVSVKTNTLRQNGKLSIQANAQTFVASNRAPDNQTLVDKVLTDGNEVLRHSDTVVGSLQKAIEIGANVQIRFYDEAIDNLRRSSKRGYREELRQRVMWYFTGTAGYAVRLVASVFIIGALLKPVIVSWISSPAPFPFGIIPNIAIGDIPDFVANAIVGVGLYFLGSKIIDPWIGQKLLAIRRKQLIGLFFRIVVWSNVTSRRISGVIGDIEGVQANLKGDSLSYPD